MSETPRSSPIGDAMAWVSRITALGVAMFLPVVGGGWLDRRLGTGFLAPLGLALGFAAGVFWLVQIGSRRRDGPRP